MCFLPWSREDLLFSRSDPDFVPVCAVLTLGKQRTHSLSRFCHGCPKPSLYTTFSSAEHIGTHCPKPPETPVFKACWACTDTAKENSLSHHPGSLWHGLSRDGSSFPATLTPSHQVSPSRLSNVSIPKTI